MEKIRNDCPEAWEGNDLELLQQARKVLKENVEKNTKEEPLTEEPKVKAEQPSAKGSNAIWWVIGILAVFTLTMKIITSVLEKKTRDTFNEIIEKNPHALDRYLNETFTYKGISFDHPLNWHFSTEDLTDDTFIADGSDENESEFIVIWSSNELKENGPESFIDGYIAEVESQSGSALNYTALYDTKFNEMPAIATDFSSKDNGEDYFGKIISFVNDEYIVAVILIANSKSALETDFHLMETTFKFTDNY